MKLIFLKSIVKKLLPFCQLQRSLFYNAVVFLQRILRTLVQLRYWIFLQWKLRNRVSYLPYFIKFAQPILEWFLIISQMSLKFLFQTFKSIHKSFAIKLITQNLFLFNSLRFLLWILNFFLQVLNILSQFIDPSCEHLNKFKLSFVRKIFRLVGFFYDSGRIYRAIPQGWCNAFWKLIILEC